MFLLQKIIAGDLELVQTVKREADEIQKRQDLLDNQMTEIKKDRASLDEKKKAAEKAIEKLTGDVYKAVGKSVISKFLWIVGASAVGAWLWMKKMGLVP